MSVRPLGSPSFQRQPARNFDEPSPTQPPPAELSTGWRPRSGAARRAEPAVTQQAPRLDEVAERAVLEGVRKPGKLLTLTEGSASQPLALSIHGINGDPDDVQPFIDDAAANGQTAMTFCYDDQYRRLTQSSKELASQLGRWIEQNPGRPIEISAHSMGSRVVLSALERLNAQGKLTMPVDLRMVAPPLGGYGSANFASLAPRFIGERIAGVQPGKDMGTWTGFQRELEHVRLPENVNVTVFTAGRDDVVDSSTERFGRIVDNLGARVVHLPDADHVSSVEQAARYLRDNPR